MIEYSLNHPNYCSPTQNIRVFLCYFISFWCLFVLNTMMTTTTCVLRTNQDRIYMEFDTFSLPERAFWVKFIAYIVCYRNHESRLIQKRVKLIEFHSFEYFWAQRGRNIHLKMRCFAHISKCVVEIWTNRARARHKLCSYMLSVRQKLCSYMRQPRHKKITFFVVQYK